jgi:hypothetical protein
MLTHAETHRPGVFDPASCRSCAREAGILDFYDQVQREERRLAEAQVSARRAYRYALWGLGLATVSILLAVATLLSG